MALVYSNGFELPGTVDNYRSMGWIVPTNGTVTFNDTAVFKPATLDQNPGSGSLKIARSFSNGLDGYDVTSPVLDIGTVTQGAIRFDYMVTETLIYGSSYEVLFGLQSPDGTMYLELLTQRGSNNFGNLRLRLNGTTTAELADALAENQWHTITIVWTSENATDFVAQVSVDGTVNMSANDGDPGANIELSKIRMGGAFAGGTGDQHFDNLCIFNSALDTDVAREIYIASYRVDGDDASVSGGNFTRSDNSTDVNVYELLADDNYATYAQTSSTGVLVMDVETINGTLGANAEIIGVTTHAAARGSTAIGGVTIGIESNSTNDESSTITTSNFGKQISHSVPNDPDTATTWVESALDSIQVRLGVV